MMQSGRLEAMLDTIALMRATRRGFGGLDGGASLLFLGISLVAGLAIGVLWYHYDLMSTFSFSQGIRYDTSLTASAVARAGAGLGIGSLTASAIIIGFTLLPSLLELIAPRVVHPGVLLMLKISVAFDFITDWPTIHAGVAGWSAIDQMGGPQWIYELVATFFAVLFVSIGLQVLLIFCVTVAAVCVLNIVGLGRMAQVRTVDGGH
jgi:hypothetical protein